MLTQTELARQEKYNQDVAPAILPVLQGTWLDPKKMGIDEDAGTFEFIEDGTHVWESFFRHWGWWKTIGTGWYSYTDLRDFYSHDRQGIGRPWLRALPDPWQSLIFRELILLVRDWNKLVEDEYKVMFDREEKFQPWVERWLSLTNQSYRRGALDLDEEIHRCGLETVNENDVSRLVKQYLASESTWRPMMPERAVYHQKYGERGEHWTFER